MRPNIWWSVELDSRPESQPVGERCKDWPSPNSPYLLSKKIHFLLVGLLLGPKNDARVYKGVSDSGVDAFGSRTSDQKMLDKLRDGLSLSFHWSHPSAFSVGAINHNLESKLSNFGAKFATPSRIWSAADYRGWYRCSRPGREDASTSGFFWPAVPWSHQKPLDDWTSTRWYALCNRTCQGFKMALASWFRGIHCSLGAFHANLTACALVKAGWISHFLVVCFANLGGNKSLKSPSKSSTGFFSLRSREFPPAPSAKLQAPCETRIVKSHLSCLAAEFKIDFELLHLLLVLSLAWRSQFGSQALAHKL